MSPTFRPTKRNPGYNNTTSPPLPSLSSENERETESQFSTSLMSPTESKFTIRELKLHTEQQRLIQLEKEKREEKLKLQQNQSTKAETEANSPGKDTSTPSPSKRRSSLMWLFGTREENSPNEEVPAGKNPIIMRRGSDPSFLKSIGRASDLTKDSLKESGVVVSHSTSLPASK